MRIGFSGTREGMTASQSHAVRRILAENLLDSVDPEEFHDGDCVGADDQAHGIASDLGYWLHLHPPIEESLRAFNGANVFHPRKPYLRRNEDIVNMTDMLVATPKSMEDRGGGTWATIRFAQRKNKKLAVIAPDGKIFENP